MATLNQLKRYIKNLYKTYTEEQKNNILNYYNNGGGYCCGAGLEGVKYYLKKCGYKTINKRTFNALKDNEKESYILKHIEKVSALKCAETLEKIDDILSAADFKKLEIKTDWVKSTTWGANPHSAAWCWSGDGCERSTGSASGCGYDKISAAYNECLKEFKSLKKLFYKTLLEKWDGVSKIGRDNPLPYGIYLYKSGLNFALNGCGLSSVINALEWCGLKVETIGGDWWDYLRATVEK